MPMLRFLGAAKCLTAFPTPRASASFHESAVFFPLVGGSLGAVTALVLAALLWLPLSLELASVLTVSFLMCSTRFLPETGLVRLSHDATPCHISVAGMCVLLCAFATRIHTLSTLAPSRFAFVIAALVAAGVLSRSAMVFLAAAARPTLEEDHPSGLRDSLVGSVPGWLLLLTGLQASVAVSLLGWKGTAPLLIGVISLVLALRWWMHFRFGGVDRQGLYAVSLMVECYVMVVAAWLRSY